MANIGALDDWEEIETQQPLDALPAGSYDLAIIDSDAEDNEKAQGRRIKVTYEIQTGPYQGRKSWDSFDIDRLSEWTDKASGERRSAYIDKSRFKTLCAALGMTNAPGDTTEMHGIIFRASAKVEQNDPNYPPRNRWNSFKEAQNGRVSSAAPPPPAARQPQQQRQAAPPAAAAPRAGNRPGWMNRQATG